MPFNCVIRDPNEVAYPSLSTQAIRLGDFLWFSTASATLKPIGGSAVNLPATWASVEVSRRDATARFIGIADFECQGIAALNPTSYNRRIKVNQICQVNVSSATFIPGDFLGFIEDAATGYLNRDTLAKVTDPRDAIGIVVENYSSATTVVNALIFGSKYHSMLCSQLIKTLVVPVGATIYDAGGDFLTDYTFGYPAVLLRLSSVINAATTGAGSITAEIGAVAVTGTLAVAAAAAGVVVHQALSGANIMEHDSVFSLIGGNGTPSAGSITLYVDYMIRGNSVL